MREFISKMFRKPLSVELLPAGERVYAFGDIHGRHDLLADLFVLIEKDLINSHCLNKVTFVFLGDYIDRGFQSRQVVDLLARQDWGGINVVFLRGNHEQTMLDFLSDARVGPQWMDYGGKETLASYGVALPPPLADEVSWHETSQSLLEALPSNHLEFLRSLKVFYQVGNCYFVHAGVDPSRSFDEQTDDDRLWIRDRFLDDTRKLEKVVVHGHTPESGAIWDGRRIGVDTGAYITNKLTAAKIEGRSVDFVST